MNDTAKAEAKPKEAFVLTSSRQFPGWLASTGASLVITTYQSGKIILIGSNRETGRLSVFERHYRIVALLTPILLHIRDGLGRELGAQLPAIHAGRPVVFEGRTGSRNAVAVARLTVSLVFSVL